MNKPKVHRAARDAAVALLLELHAQDRLDAAAYESAAAASGYSSRHLRRRVAAATDPAPNHAGRFVVDEVVLACLARHGGRMSAAHRDLQAQGRDVPSLSTFQRRVREVREVRDSIASGAEPPEARPRAATALEFTGTPVRRNLTLTLEQRLVRCRDLRATGVLTEGEYRTTRRRLLAEL